MKFYNSSKKYPFRGDALVAKKCTRHKEQNPNCRKLKWQKFTFPNALFYFCNAKNRLVLLENWVNGVLK
jgi:ribosomal protein L24E